MKSSRLALLLMVTALVGGCSSMQQIEVQNDGPGAVTVTFRYREDNRDVERVVDVPEGGAAIEGVWFYSVPPKVQIEAKWPSTVLRRTFASTALPEGLQRATSSGGIHGLSVSPRGFAWGPPTLWVRIQNPALIPIGIFIFAFGLTRWIRYRRRTA